MLKNIPPIISPELMAVMMQMGHGDELLIADGNFPADSHAQQIVRADGLGAVVLLEAILKFLPLDDFSQENMFVMHPVEASDSEPAIWAEFRDVLGKSGEKSPGLTVLERFAFYEQALQSYAIVATSETALYANLILKKGVVKPV